MTMRLILHINMDVNLSINLINLTIVVPISIIPIVLFNIGFTFQIYGFFGNIDINFNFYISSISMSVFTNPVRNYGFNFNTSKIAWQYQYHFQYQLEIYILISKFSDNISIIAIILNISKLNQQY